MSVKGLALGETKACFSFDRQGNKKKGADGPPSRARGPNQWAPLDLTWAYVYVLTPDSLKISANLTSSRSGYKRCGILFFRSECFHWPIVCSMLQVAVLEPSQPTNHIVLAVPYIYQAVYEAILSLRNAASSSTSHLNVVQSVSIARQTFVRCCQVPRGADIYSIILVLLPASTLYY